MNSQQPQTLLITGASSGIGYALTQLYLAQGHRVVALARQMETLEALRQSYPDSCIPVPVDLTQAAAVEQLAANLQTRIGGVDVAILNAGTCEYVDVQNLQAAPFAQVMAINWQGFVNSLLLAMPLLRMQLQHRAEVQLVGVSSMASILPMPRSQAYGASKAAMEYMLNSLRVDLQQEPIAISIVRPGFVQTPLTARNDFPMPWSLTAEQAAEKIARGIARKQWLIEFPWPLVWLMHAIAWLPLCWQTWLLQKTVARTSVNA